MQSCLGIYVQDNLIKYAKISKERNNVKIDAYGVKFFDVDIEKTIDQIIKETFSYQVPISVNINNEKYTYSTVFGLLKEQDKERAMETEFEYFCNNNNLNKNTIEYRKIKVENLEDKDRERVIYPYIDKTTIVEKIQLFDKYKLKNISPVPVIIKNLQENSEQNNCYIINLEGKTTITTVINGKVYSIDKLDLGMNNVLKVISERENSIQRAYEICKNTTVYTRTGQNLKVEGNEYLDDIVTIIFEIIEQIKRTINQVPMNISNIYITGMGLIINNIDLLFQENFIDKKCEILVPYFVEKTNVKINIKDYIEVNSAISLALQGTDNKNKEANFNDSNEFFDRIKEILTSDVGKGTTVRKKPKKQKLTAKQTLQSDTDFIDNILLRTTTAAVLVVILYIGTTFVLSNQINEKLEEAQITIDSTKTKIAEVDKMNKLVTARTSEYENFVRKIDDANSLISQNYLSKDAIPDLLTQITFTIPTGVQILSISNASGKRIEITAQAEKYDQLGYFKAALEEEGILKNITTTKGVKQDNLINITITGELPF